MPKALVALSLILLLGVKVESAKQPQQPPESEPETEPEEPEEPEEQEEQDEDEATSAKVEPGAVTKTQMRIFVSAMGTLWKTSPKCSRWARERRFLDAHPEFDEKELHAVSDAELLKVPFLAKPDLADAAFDKTKFFMTYCYEGLESLEFKQVKIIINLMFNDLLAVKKPIYSGTKGALVCPSFESIGHPNDQRPTTLTIDLLITVDSFMKRFQKMYSGWFQGLPMVLVENKKTLELLRENRVDIGALRRMLKGIENSLEFEDLVQYFQDGFQETRRALGSLNCLFRDMLSFFKLEGKFIPVFTTKKSANSMVARVYEIVEAFSKWKRGLKKMKTQMGRYDFMASLFISMISFNKKSIDRGEDVDGNDQEMGDVNVLLMSQVMARFFRPGNIIIKKTDLVMSAFKRSYFDVAKALYKLELAMNVGEKKKPEWVFEKFDRLGISVLCLLSLWGWVAWL